MIGSIPLITSPEYRVKMNKYRLLTTLSLCLLVLTGTQAQSDDFGVWTSIQAEKKIIKGLTAELEGEFRTRDSFSTVDRWAGSADLSYRIIQYLKVGGSYSLIRFNHENRGWETGHRYSLYATGSYKWNRVTFSLREKYQHTYRVGVTKTSKRANPKEVLRSRLQAVYNIKKSPFSPYLSCELYHTLNDPQGNGLDKTRYTAGTRYKLTKKHSFDLFYRFQDKADDDEQDGHILGIGYTYKFK